MTSMVLILSALAAANSESAAAAELYREACVKGELRLNPQDGSLVEFGDLPDDVRWMRRYNHPAQQATYVKMTYPASTYVLMTTYKTKRPKAVASECIVASPCLRLKMRRAPCWRERLTPGRNNITVTACGLHNG